MTPSFDTRLQAIIGALEHLVLPALADADSIVQEQAGLALGHLQIIRAQLPHASDYEAICLREMIATGEALLDCAEGGEAMRAAVEVLVGALAVGNVSNATDHRNAVAAAIDGLIVAGSMDGSPGFRARSHIILIEHGARQSVRDRTWYAQTGLDPDRGDLGTIEAMIAADSPRR